MSHQHNFYDSPHSMNKQIKWTELTWLHSQDIQDARRRTLRIARTLVELVWACHENISHALTFYGCQNREGEADGDWERSQQIMQNRLVEHSTSQSCKSCESYSASASHKNPHRMKFSSSRQLAQFHLPLSNSTWPKWPGVCAYVCVCVCFGHGTQGRSRVPWQSRVTNVISSRNAEWDEMKSAYTQTA